MAAEAERYMDVVHQRAVSAPDAVAFEIDEPGGGTRRLTYGQLVERVAALGTALQAGGLGDGERVALCLENRPEWPIAYLAVWYGGGITVPLDPQLGSTAIGNLLRHSGTRACFTSTTMLPKLLRAIADLDPAPRLLLVDPEAPGVVGAPRAGSPAAGASPAEAAATSAEGARSPQSGAAAAGVEPVPDLLAAHPMPPGEPWKPRPPGEFGSIMYTSGTTGHPKGVMISRRAVVENLESALRVVEFSPADRILGVLPLFHVLPLVANCLGPLYLGARVVFLAELTAESILAAFRRHRITVFICVPAFFYRFHDRLQRRLEELGPLRRRLASFLLSVSRWTRRRLRWRLGRRLLAAAHRPFGDQMRLFVTGGARFDPEVYEDLLDWGFTLAQGYGLTEATAVLTISSPEDLRGDTVGKPIPGIELRIHEPDSEGVGEIWARGPSIMRGYYRNPEATDQVIVDGWLRTGDLGRILPDDHLQVTGRAKDVIVLASGKNIYPEELEAHYGECDLIDEICIVGLADDSGRGERLHAVVVPDLEAARRRGYVNVREMVKWELDGLAARLPSPQRITSFELRHEPLPRTTTRKVKRFEVLEQARGPKGAAGKSPAPGVEAASPVAAPGAAAGMREGPSEEWPGDEEPWAKEALRAIARHAEVGSVRRDDHLDLDLGLESLDRVELFAELEGVAGVALGDETAGELHTVGEVLEAIAARLREPGAARDEPSGERWQRILTRAPEGVGGYLRRRPISEPLLWSASRIVRPLLRVTNGYRIAGLENLPGSFPFLLCPNHFSYIDPFMLALAMPFSVFRRIFFVGYSEYFEGPVAGTLGRWVRNVPIDANRHLERAMQAAAEGLRRGLVLVIFPEGGRSIDGEVQRFRGGAAILARHFDVPLVPVGIWGTFEMWPRGGRLRRHPVGIAVGEPVFADGGDLHERLRERVVDLVEVARRLHEP